MGLQEGRGEKEVILECFPILKNVPAKHTLMYFMCQAGTWSSISAGRCCFLFQLLLCSDSDSAGTQLCLYVVLQIHVHTVNWKFIFILYLFLNQVSFTQLDAVTVTYIYGGAGGTSDCKQPEKGNHEVTEAGRDLWRSYSPVSCSKNHLVSVGSCCSGALPVKC